MTRASLVVGTLLCMVVPGLSAQGKRPVRRLQVTPELQRSAFRDSSAPILLERARAARLAQDSTLQAYDANTYFRVSVGLGIRRIGAERLFMRTEHAAHVRWSHDVGLMVEPTGRRTAFPMGSAQLDLTAATPIPYFPGRESLWFPGGGVAEVEVDENEFLHPLATGAEAYYRYATGDSATIRLPDGRAIRLRELRITARRPEWRAFVGSFWFDAERGSLVRAAYRMAVDMDVWQMASEEQRREIEELEQRAKADTGAVAVELRRRAERERRESRGNRVWSSVFTPMRANISAITVEYGLHQGRFWLPRLNIAEGEMLAGFIRVPVKVEERFRYNSVNVADSALQSLMARTTIRAEDTLYVVPGYVNLGIGAGRRSPPDTSAAAIVAREDSIIRRNTMRADSIRARADSARAKGDSDAARELSVEANWYSARARQIVRHREGCANDSTYYAGSVSRFEGALRITIRAPCDTSGLATSPDLPRSIFDSGEEVAGGSERDMLVDALGMSLQADWGPQKPVLHTGLDLLRYNRIEGLSLGASATSALGRGYTARAVARVGVSDLVPNAELSLERSNGRTDIRLTAYHRLAVANDDWGSPLSFGASLANLLYARDEGFYYRAFGAEITGLTHAPLLGANMQWRLFAEGERGAGLDPKTQGSLGNLIGNVRFGSNIDATKLAALGARIELTRSFGVNPLTTHFDSRVRLEGAAVDARDAAATGYGRIVGDGTLARPLGRFTTALTGAAGTSAGRLPIQRAFFVGGLHTVRGQFAKLDSAGRVGTAFWLARGELGLVKSLALRPTVFYDIGWAGAREDFIDVGRPLSGAGIGLSMLDGLARVDLARGIWPEQRWRADLYVGARF